MLTKEDINELRDFFENERVRGKKLLKYSIDPNLLTVKSKFKISFGLNKYKEIILKEETGLELGGRGKDSFILIYLIKNEKMIKDGQITLLGSEIKEIEEDNVHFGLLCLIEVSESSEKEIGYIDNLSFVSNGIEGFMIRSIPRKFWCRISSEVLKKGFSFEFLGTAFYYLFKESYGDKIDRIEIFFINNDLDSIKEFLKVNASIQDKYLESNREKIEKWRKKIECEYDWGCHICPYRFECQKFKEILIKRENIE